MQGPRLIAAALTAFVALAVAGAPGSGDARSILADRRAPAEIDPSFPAYLDALRSAVATRDVEGVIALSTPEVKLSFGGDEGPGGARRIFGAPDTEAWDALGRLLDDGFAWDGETAVTPYWFAAEAPTSFDPYFTYFVDGKDVLLREGPGRSHPAIGAVSHDFVLTHDVDVNATEPYEPVELANGRLGFMARRYLRQLIDYRAGFEKVDGAWKMRFFLAGD